MRNRTLRYQYNSGLYLFILHKKKRKFSCRVCCKLLQFFLGYPKNKKMSVSNTRKEGKKFYMFRRKKFIIYYWVDIFAVVVLFVFFFFPILRTFFHYLFQEALYEFFSSSEEFYLCDSHQQMEVGEACVSLSFFSTRITHKFWLFIVFFGGYLITEAFILR